jgi:nucleotide-binding universal stress UspA family protein
MFRNILVALDESPEAARALQVAIGLARDLPAELTAISVIEPQPAYYSFSPIAYTSSQWKADKRRFYSSLQADARQRAKAVGLWIDTELMDGDEVGSILRCAREKRVDLLIVGMPQHRILVGNTGKQISERSPCPVMGVR